VAAGILFFIAANILAWFQLNSQFVWGWWANRPLTSAAIFAIPVGLMFWYAIKNIVGVSGSLWTSKLIGFGVGNIVFAILTWVLLKESVFTPKTMTSLTLAGAIIAIQMLWK